jgi:DNA-binding HxlR family transcriptional regulator
MATMNAAAQRDAARCQYDANLAQCPGHEVLATLSDKWVTLVLSALGDGPLRHGELARTIAGATQKMLTQTLRKLERDGLITRTVITGLPARVEYDLIPLGHSILPVQQAIKSWAETHIEAIHAARTHFDSRLTRAVDEAARLTPPLRPALSSGHLLRRGRQARPGDPALPEF